MTAGRHPHAAFLGDTLDEGMNLVECAYMAAAALEPEEAHPLQQVLDEARRRFVVVRRGLEQGGGIAPDGSAQP